MSSFYLSDPLVLNELRLQDDDFRIYCHCCKQFNVKTLTAFVRLVDISGQFQLSMEQVQLSIARLARIRIENEPLIKITAGRHLVVEQNLDSEFIRNDAELHENQSMLLITGPNMGGKSTYMRQIASICVLAHIGSYVPAEAALIGSIDKIFTRIGASDDLAGGQSTFMV